MKSNFILLSCPIESGYVVRSKIERLGQLWIKKGKKFTTFENRTYYNVKHDDLFDRWYYIAELDLLYRTKGSYHSKDGFSGHELKLIKGSNE
jgi:hypothetical protein